MIPENSFAAFHTRLRGFIDLFTGRLPSETGETNEFEALARTLFELQFETVPVLHELCVRRGITPSKLKHWSDIPALPTSAFKEYAVSSLGPGQRTHVFHSSGTSQQVPSRHFHDDESLATYEASLRLWFKPHFLGDHESQRQSIDLLVLTPSPALAPHSSLAHMFGAVRSAFARGLFAGKIDQEGAWILDFEIATARLQQAIEENRPIAVVGTAFSFVHLFDYCQEKNLPFKLPAGSRVMETGGYKGRSRVLSKKELYELITRRVGVPMSHIISEYGMSELSSQAYDSRITSLVEGAARLTRAFHFPPWARVQVISAETGVEVDDREIGLVRVFDLANVRSVLAIQTEDLAIRRGSGFELIAVRRKLNLAAAL